MKWGGPTMPRLERPKPAAAYINFFLIIPLFSTEKWGVRPPCQKSGGPRPPCSSIYGILWFFCDFRETFHNKLLPFFLLILSVEQVQMEIILDIHQNSNLHQHVNEPAKRFSRKTSLIPTFNLDRWWHFSIYISASGQRHFLWLQRK